MILVDPKKILLVHISSIQTTPIPLHTHILSLQLSFNFNFG